MQRALKAFILGDVLIVLLPVLVAIIAFGGARETASSTCLTGRLYSRRRPGGMRVRFQICYVNA